MPSCREGFAQSWKPDNAAIARYCPWVHKLCLSAGLAWAQACANSIILLAHHSSGGAGNAICTSHCVCPWRSARRRIVLPDTMVWQLPGVLHPLFCDSPPLCGHNICWVLLWCYVFLGTHNTRKLSPVSQKERIWGINLFFMFTRKLEMSERFSWLLELGDSAPD